VQNPKKRGLSPSHEGNMPNERKSMQSIRTMGALVDSRRTRTAAGALLELSAMANEKMLLRKELERFTRRHQEIKIRLAELAAKETRLLTLVQGPGAAALGPPPEGELDATISRRVKVKEFTY
jgi:hypothetical protein